MATDARNSGLLPKGPTDYRDVVKLLALNAYAAWSSALRAAHSPGGSARYERLAHPQPGDLVLETTRGVTTLMRDTWDEHGRALGWMHPPQNAGDDCVVEALDGTITNWSNARFVAVLTPELDRELREAERAEMDARAEALRSEHRA